MDTQQWQHWPRLFTDDVHAIYEGAPRHSADDPRDIDITGCETLVEGVKTLMKGAQSIHQGFMPELKMTSTNQAEGIWSMFDYVMLLLVILKVGAIILKNTRKQTGNGRLKKYTLNDYILKRSGSRVKSCIKKLSKNHS